MNELIYWICNIVIVFAIFNFIIAAYLIIKVAATEQDQECTFYIGSYFYRIEANYVIKDEENATIEVQIMFGDFKMKL